MCEKGLLLKLEKYCAYQERCHSEVKTKAKSIGMPYSDIDLALLHLIKGNFLNEERFAALFARSKMNQKKWGPIKIELELRKKNISKNLITKSLISINQEQFTVNLEKLAEKFQREKQISITNIKDRKKLIQHLMFKGYPYEMIKHTFSF